MAITLAEAKTTIESEGFRFADSTCKVVEYTSPSNGRVLYLRVNQGFPDHADIVIHPEVDASALLVIPDIEANKRVVFRFGSNMPKFPKRMNEGVKPAHYGRAFYAYSAAALGKLCREYGQGK